MRSPMMGNKEHQDQDHHRDKSQPAIIQDLARKLGFAFLPVPQLNSIFHANLIWVLQIADELLRGGIAILGITLQSAVNDLLQLRRDGRVGDAWRKRMVQQAVIHGG